MSAVIGSDFRPASSSVSFSMSKGPKRELGLIEGEKKPTLTNFKWNFIFQKEEK